MKYYGYEYDEPGDNPYPELGSLHAQRKVDIGVFAPDDSEEAERLATEDADAQDQDWMSAREQEAANPLRVLQESIINLNQGLCVCGKPLGHGPDEEDEETGGAGDPDAENTLEAKLQSAFGDLLPGANVKVFNADESFFTKEDLIVLNAALQLMASTILSVEAMRERDFDTAKGFAKMSRRALDTAQSFVGSGEYALNTLGTMGERILDLAQDMNDGKTVGLVVAPF